MNASRNAVMVILDVAMATTPGPAPSDRAPAVAPPPPAPAKAPPADDSPPHPREVFGVGRQLVFTTDVQASVATDGKSAAAIALTADVFLGHGFSLGAAFLTLGGWVGLGG